MTDEKLGADLATAAAAILAGYAEQMEFCRRLWEATEDPLVLARAIGWARLCQQPPEAWVEEAVVRALVQGRSKAQAKRHYDDMTDLDRYSSVVEARAGGMSWDQAIQVAAEKFGLSDETVRKSYKRVRRQFRERQAGRFRYCSLEDYTYKH